MKTTNKFACLTALAAFFIFAQSVAQAGRFDETDLKLPALQQYQSHTQGSLYLCRLVFQLASASSKLSSAPDIKMEDIDYIGCAREAKEKSQTLLRQALKTVKKAPAKEALKSYQVAYAVALEGIDPKNEEPVFAYKQRASAADTKLTDAWARFEVEQ